MDVASLLLVVIKVSIVLTVLGLGLNAAWQDALFLLRHPWLLLRSLLSMNVLMPLVAAGFVVAFNLPASVKVALLALAISPVPPILPQKELKAGGQESFAVGLLATIAVLAIFTVPLSVSWLTSAFDRTGGIAPLAVAKIVLASVLVPLAAGMMLRHWARPLAESISRPIAILGMVMLVASALPLAYAAWPAISDLIRNGTVLVIATMATIGLVVGHALGGPRSDDRTVLALSTASRHPAVALSAAVAGGAESKSALAAILLYLIVATIVSVPYVAWRRRKSTAFVPPSSQP